MEKFKIEFARREHDVDHYLGSLKVHTENGSHVCNLQQAVGHCCGATFMGQMSYYHLKEEKDVNAFLDWLRAYRKDRQQIGRNYWFIQNLYFYLSRETVGFDAHLRQKGVKLHEFSNRTGDEMSLSVVELWYIQL